MFNKKNKSTYIFAGDLLKIMEKIFTRNRAMIVLTVMLTNFISCKKNELQKVYTYTVSSENEKQTVTRTHGSNETSYYNGGTGGCSGSSTYQYGMTSVGYMVSQPELDEFKELFRIKLKFLLNQNMVGYFDVLPDRIYYNSIPDSYQYMSFKNYFHQAFSEAKLDSRIEITLIESSIQVYQQDISCSTYTGPTVPVPTDPGQVGGGIGTPLLIISLNDRLKYPSLASIVDNLYNKVKNDKRLMSALKEYSHLSEEAILEDMKSGQGPRITVVDKQTLVGGAIAQYDNENKVLLISDEAAYDSNYFSTQYPTATELYLSACILHEYIHFGENITQIFVGHEGRFDDAGFQFENKYYGGRLEYNKVSGIVTLHPL